MNQQRRKEIEKAKVLIDEAKQILETAQSDERDYYDNMPESLQGSEKGQAAEAAADTLQEAIDACDEVAGHIEQAAE